MRNKIGVEFIYILLLCFIFCFIHCALIIQFLIHYALGSQLIQLKSFYPSSDIWFHRNLHHI